MIDLRERTEISRDKKSKKQFKIKTMKKEIHLRADSEKDRDEWVDLLVKINQKHYKSLMKLSVSPNSTVDMNQSMKPPALASLL